MGPGLSLPMVWWACHTRNTRVVVANGSTPFTCLVKYLVVVPALGTGKFSSIVPERVKLESIDVAERNAMVFHAVEEPKG